jgi:GT2 family glycosyltransferase/tetratricopeptide (TPR) repeat protein/protein-L-isoaspartate O-methyltransferase
MTNARSTALLIQLEFPTWATARAWTYSAGYAVQEGLTANGIDCVTVPAIVGTPSSSPQSWLCHAKRWLQGKRFDQVWVWLVHSPLDEAYLEWLSTLAPIRVGVLMESLQYDEDDYRHVPQLKGRAALVEQQIRFMTHVLAPDELDAESLNDRRLTRALWWPCMVPSRAIAMPTAMPSQRRGVFHGTPYGPRQRWLGDPSLRGVMACEGPINPPTYHQTLFDRLQDAAAQCARSGQAVTEAILQEYVTALQGIRAGEYAEWMAGLSQWAAIVNLPSLAKFYGGRVFEGIAVGRPVVSWAVPNRPKNRALFDDAREIVLFDKDDPQSLARRLHRLLADDGLRQSMATRAQDRLRTFHTAERRLQDTLQWIGTGAEPNYGLHALSPERGVHQATDDMGIMSSRSATPALANASAEKHAHTDQFYEQLFIDTPHWATPHPNPDEAARWSKIAGFLEMIRRHNGHAPLRMAEVGCGRGWLTNLLSTYYGTCEGVEPVAGVIERAKTLFPSRRFTAGTATTLLEQPDFQPYDVVISSEVIEHVPHGEQAAFVHSLRALLKPGGYIVLTTPRGDVWDQWRRIAPPNQPIEDWLTEQELRGLWDAEGLQCVGLERVYVEVPTLRFVPAPTPDEQRTLNLLPIYQIWACQWLGERTDGIMPRINHPPMVSVIVPTFNRPDRLREALESILAQTFKDFEIIVVNDGDGDVSPVIDALPHAGRITCVKHPRNKGLAASRNTGLRLARGIYIAYLDDDDRYQPDHLAVLADALQQGEFQVAYSDAWRAVEDCTGGRRRVIQRDLPYSYDFSPARLLVTNYFPVLCLMHARACLDEVGVFDETLFAHEDWDLWIRMATKYPFLHITQTTAEFSWRTDGSSMTSGTKETYLRTTEIIYRKYRPHAERLPGVIAAQQHELSIRQRDLGRKPVSCSIVIPVWNRRDLTEQCLVRLAAVTAATDGCDYEVILVDNGSSDTTPELLSMLSGDVRVIRNEQNRGFAAACNQGAKASRGRYLVFLNNDTLPLEGWLTALVQEVERSPEVAVVGSKLLYEDGTIQHGGVAFSWLYGTAYHVYLRVPADAPMVNRRRELQAVTAACMLVRRTAFEAAGGFDEGFRNGFEDVDLCLNIRERGGRVVYQPKSVLYHLESQTPGRKAHERENIRRFLTRWSGHWWLADEYVIYAEDGLACHMWKENETWGERVLPFADSADRAQWEYVASMQRLTHRRDPAALAELKHALIQIQKWPQDGQALRWGAYVCRHIGLAQYEHLFWSRLLTMEDAAEARIALARRAIEQGDIPEAESHIAGLMNTERDRGEGWLLRGVVDMQRHAYADAIVAFETALRFGGDERKARMGCGMAAIGENRLDDAWRCFHDMLQASPDDAEAIHWLLRAGTVLQRWPELSDALQSFVQRNPSDLSVRYAFAGVLLRCGRHALARAQYDAVRLLDPSYDGLPELAHAIEEHEACGVPHAR